VTSLRSLVVLGSSIAWLSACTPDAPAPGKTADSKGDVKPEEAKFDNKVETKTDAKTDAPKPRGKQIPPPEDVAAPPADATKTASGLAYKQLTAGTGDASPKQNDTVKINSTGWTTDGATFETTDGAKPKTVQVAKAIPGWTEMFQLMKVGEKVRVWVPEELA
jgi:FKBP-type peptidyl-prolyl cis-trans isomerase